MPKKSKDSELTSSQKKMRQAVLDSLNQQRENTVLTRDAYTDLNKKLGVELLPFVEIAVDNVLNVIDKQIEILERTMK